MDPDSMQVSLAAPYPGTLMYEQAVTNGWFNGTPLLNSDGVQIPAIQYPGLSAEDLEAAVDTFYKAYYFRPRPLWRMIKPMFFDRDLRRRRLREGRQFLSYLGKRQSTPPADGAAAAASCQ
jgi:hypothetical protein